jgi:L-fuculose-phosphate aldolase
VPSRVRLREVRPADLPVLFEHQADPEASRMAAFPSRDREAFFSHWAGILADPQVTARTILFEGRVAGNILSFERSGRRLVGYWIGRKHWDRGVASRALSLFLRQVPTRPLYAHVARHNIASLRVLEKCGFAIASEDAQELILQLPGAAPALRTPAQQVVAAMDRIYRNGLTTTSGGNVSMKLDGAIWISPGSTDKGSLRADQVVRVSPAGLAAGAGRPSLELVFHRAIYEARPDAGAVIHAHPPALVAFSVAHGVPDTRILTQIRSICGPVGYAPYALPGSEALARHIARILAGGHDMAIMENHAVVCLAADLPGACGRLETLELCAGAILKAGALGTVHTLTEEQLALAAAPVADLPESPADSPGGSPAPAEEEARQELCGFIRRGCRQRLFSSTAGTISLRLDGRSFLITPSGCDRNELTEGDLVAVRDGQRETGKRPSRAALLHRMLYELHPAVGAVILAQPPNLTAFSISHSRLDARIMPESFVLLREVELLPFGIQYRDPQALARSVSAQRPVVLIENEGLLVTGANLLQAFDRLEVAEFTASSILLARGLGAVVNLPEQARREISDAYIRD